MKRRSNGTRSIAVELGGGSFAFRYLAADGSFFDEPDADAVVPNGMGGTHSVLVVP